MTQNIISITASLKKFSIAVQFKNQLYEIYEELDSSQYLVYYLREFLIQNNINIKEINGVITASGPGSFTGIRVAQSVSKAIALAMNINAACVSYFDVIEHLANTYNNKIDQNYSNILLVIKSEKNQVYYRYKNLIGVCEYKNLIEIILSSCLDTKNIILAGNAIEELQQYFPENCYFFENSFESAKHLLNFSELLSSNSTINPLYINARSC